MFYPVLVAEREPELQDALRLHVIRVDDTYAASELVFLGAWVRTKI